MRISARNTLTGTVRALTLGDIEAEVTLEVSPGVELTPTVTRASAERPGLEVGRPAPAVIKASDVMIAVGE